jgi:LysR family transcriptional activator of nhaA
VVGEFEDAALAKIVATDGIGVTVVPTAVMAEAIERYGFVSLGRTEECQIQLYLITAERRIEHPVVALLAREAEAVSAKHHRRSARTPGRGGSRQAPARPEPLAASLSVAHPRRAL